MEDQFEMIVKGRQFKHLMENRSMQLRKKFGLKRMEMEVLYFLSISGEHNTSADICRYLNVNKGHISQTMERLGKMHFLQAVQDRNDRRYVHYLLTDNAQEVVDGIQESWEDLNQQIFEGITEDERIAYKKISDKISKNMDKMISS
ncbi:MAG: MarR family winged helix-turn-helix transcriptional regulator [Coprococcus sp.]